MCLGMSVRYPKQPGAANFPIALTIAFMSGIPRWLRQ